ncbi:hypothetical protein P152DRAFT_460159 [Eremomyces bilateralis CBS 781.70]|uniref:FAD-binding FR-type domain-containing protein n=1 Tax=Eremomyces bilateralis CBS 781.70 TaxID=1392243 RepID=A0A6G1FYT7_9PEZI|nr:uncharacterized protein P152DRAFT_460159 [Eremomyces bilateralis CBS 781.70]KAF1810860.1 hypothetical protein P152DRAFT_460159 [Eremomyces bilateralis CBS 781.70]
MSPLHTDFTTTIRPRRPSTSSSTTSHTKVSYSSDPIPHQPHGISDHNLRPRKSSNASSSDNLSPRFSGESIAWSSDSEAPGTPSSSVPESQLDHVVDKVKDQPVAAVTFTGDRERRASTTLLSGDNEQLRRILGDGQAGTKLIERYCCGGGCCLSKKLPIRAPPNLDPVQLPDNDAFRGLQLRLTPLSLKTELTAVPELPESKVSFTLITENQPKHVSAVHKHPPDYLQPHPPYHVYSAPLYHARELTKPGAEKRTFHFDIDVTDYPSEGGVDFKVGGAIGICPANSDEVVDSIFNALGVPSFVRDKPVTLNTTTGRWPTIWGEEQPRSLPTTRRELLAWCVDLQSQPPTKQLLRLLAEHTSAPNEKKILTYLVSAEGQGAFCDLRTGPHITVPQLLAAFPSARPPLDQLLSVLPQLMPRFYSLSNDPHVSSTREGLAGRRLIEMAVTVHETPDWVTHINPSTGAQESTPRTGVGSGFLERIAQQFISTTDTFHPPTPTLHIPMFRGLMANPLSREFTSDGPMLLIGAGVGMAPFRGFILNRLRTANCANKIWLIQGIRDASLDELYRGELGPEELERQIKRVVQSRKPTLRTVASSPEGSAPGSPALKATATPITNGDTNSANDSTANTALAVPPSAAPLTPVVTEVKYVQDEVRAQAETVWYVANAVDGRVFVCGSSKGMGEGVEDALVGVVMEKGGVNEDEAREFWARKRAEGGYIAETW